MLLLFAVTHLLPQLRYFDSNHMTISGSQSLAHPLSSYARTLQPWTGAMGFFRRVVRLAAELLQRVELASLIIAWSIAPGLDRSIPAVRSAGRQLGLWSLMAAGKQVIMLGVLFQGSTPIRSSRPAASRAELLMFWSCPAAADNQSIAGGYGAKAALGAAAAGQAGLPFTAAAVGWAVVGCAG